MEGPGRGEYYFRVQIFCMKLDLLYEGVAGGVRFSRDMVAFADEVVGAARRCFDLFVGGSGGTVGVPNVDRVVRSDRYGDRRVRASIMVGGMVRGSDDAFLVGGSADRDEEGDYFELELTVGNGAVFDRGYVLRTAMHELGHIFDPGLAKKDTFRGDDEDRYYSSDSEVSADLPAFACWLVGQLRDEGFDDGRILRFVKSNLDLILTDYGGDRGFVYRAGGSKARKRLVNAIVRVVGGYE